MDWNARLQEAQAMWENGERTEASELFEEIAEATSDPQAIRSAMASTVFLALADIGANNAGIMPVSPFMIEDMDKALKWMDIAENNETLNADIEVQNSISDNRKICLAAKGKYLYLLQDAACEESLIDAVNLGDNQSRVFLALRYKDIAGALVDEGNPDKVDQISENYRKMISVFEDYVKNYDPQEAESDEYRMACSILANQYQSGMVCPVDMDKAQKYEALAATFNEETKTSNPSAYTQPTRTHQQSTASSGNRNSGGGCYIATAVYGSYDCPEVWTLRRYRDDKLLQSTFGRMFVKAYYATSPTVVKLFGETEWFNRFWRGKLNRMVAKLKEEGYDDTPYNDR